MNTASADLQLDVLRARYAAGVSPREVIGECLARVTADAGYNAWITVLEPAALEPHFARLEQLPRSAPLWGVPFAIKDNIDLAGVPTTAACEAWRHVPPASAAVVELLLAAGAVPLGKTNLDQFAAGLNGTRSPFGECHNAFYPELVSGGSSSGSAVAVARGHVSFALGTDTAGSGRVPAAFNALVGIKPSRGRLSTRGVLPACRTLDCVTVFAQGAADAAAVCELAAVFDDRDPHARRLAPAPAVTRRLGVPRADQLCWGPRYDAACWQRACDHAVSLGLQLVELDFEPLLAAGELLYQGPWLAERYHVLGELLRTRRDALLPVTADIVAGGADISAVDAFDGMYRLAALRRAAETVLAAADVLMLPTAPGFYSRAELGRDPVGANTELGRYTNFMNLLDLAAVSVPAPTPAGHVPFGVTLFHDAGSDVRLAQLAVGWQRGDLLPGDLLPGGGAADGWIDLAVCGAHMAGLALNHQLVRRGGYLVERTRTAADYRLFALAGGPPQRPGLVRAGSAPTQVRAGGAPTQVRAGSAPTQVRAGSAPTQVRAGDSSGVAIEVEVWRLPHAGAGALLAEVPAPLALGTVQLADGRHCHGFICEVAGLDGARDISAAGSWRRFLAASS